MAPPAFMLNISNSTSVQVVEPKIPSKIDLSKWKNTPFIFGPSIA